VHLHRCIRSQTVAPVTVTWHMVACGHVAVHACTAPMPCVARAGAFSPNHAMALRLSPLCRLRLVESRSRPPRPPHAVLPRAGRRRRRRRRTLRRWSGERRPAHCGIASLLACAAPSPAPRPLASHKAGRSACRVVGSPRRPFRPQTPSGPHDRTTWSRVAPRKASEPRPPSVHRRLTAPPGHGRIRRPGHPARVGRTGLLALRGVGESGRRAPFQPPRLASPRLATIYGLRVRARFRVPGNVST
jgi:hypothetical protein